MQTIYIPVWDAHVYILEANDPIRKKLAKLGVKKEDIDDVMDGSSEADAICSDNGDGIIVLQEKLPPARKIATLAHEVFHITQCMLGVRGVKLSNETDNEAHAYLIGYIMEKVVEKFII